jgi:glycosyltransferase involved in cell wall biosynthesis
MKDLVSIYIPTKNRLALLRRAVNSVLAQTHRNIEIIVVSDGSDDGTCEYVRSIESDISIKLIENKQSIGACASRNLAIEIADGEFVTGLDDDDIFLPHRIEAFVKKWRSLEENGSEFSCLFDRRIVNAGSSVYLWDTDSTVNVEGILQSNAVGNQVFTTPQRLLDIGGFDAAMPAWQDWELWVRLIKKFGPGESIESNSYIMDISHEFERITLKSSSKILSAAKIFRKKHCDNNETAGILYSLGGYEQIRLSISDIWVILRSKNRRKFKLSARKIISGQFRISFESSIL